MQLAAALVGNICPDYVYSTNSVGRFALSDSVHHPQRSDQPSHRSDNKRPLIFFPKRLVRCRTDKQSRSLPPSLSAAYLFLVLRGRFHWSVNERKTAAQRRRGNNTHSLCVPSSLPKRNQNLRPRLHSIGFSAPNPPLSFLSGCCSVRPPDTPILTPPYGGFLSAPTMTTYLLSKKRGERRRRRWGWGGKGNGVEWRKGREGEGSEMSVRSQMAPPEAKKKLGRAGERENQRIGERSETRIPDHSTTSPLLHA